MIYKNFTANPLEYSKLSYKKRWAMEIVDELAATPSTNEKVEILKKAFAEHPGFTLGCKLCYSPRIKFWIKKIPEYIPARASAFSCSRILDDLNVIYNRIVTGNAASDKLRQFLESAEVQDAEFMARVVSRDLGCGISAGLINKAYKALNKEDLIPEFPVMLCTAFDKTALDNFVYPAFVQTKMDGMRINAVYKPEAQAVTYHTRNGNMLEDEPQALSNYIIMHIAPALKTPNGFVLDGEMLIVDKFGKPISRKEGNGILTRLIRGTSSEEDRNRVRFVVWDVIPSENFWKGDWSASYKTRFEFLKTALNKVNQTTQSDLVTLVKTATVKTPEEALNIFQEELVSGNEGIILKSEAGKWKSSRVKWQLKVKAEIEMDAVVTGVQEGTGKYEGKLGALVCRGGDENGPIEFNVGTGFDDKEREELWANPPIGKVVNVKYNEIISSKDGGPRSLFLPVWIEVRNDVNPF